MSTVIDFPYCDNFDRHQLPDSVPAANQFEHDPDLQSLRSISAPSGPATSGAPHGDVSIQLIL